MNHIGVLITGKNISSIIFDHQNGPTIQSHAPVANHADENLIVQELHLIMHADACMKTLNVQCTMQHCQTMKEVLNQLSSCNKSKDCPRAHCSSTKQIINHWNICKRFDCPICSSLWSSQRQNNHESVQQSIRLIHCKNLRRIIRFNAVFSPP